MKEKIYLKKSSQGAKGPSAPSSFLRFGTLLKFGIVLLVWIAIIPLLWHQKTKTADDKGAGGKNVVVKEIPKAPPASPSAEQNSPPRDVLPDSPVVAAKPSPAPEPEKGEATAPGVAPVSRPGEPLPTTTAATGPSEKPVNLEKREPAPAVTATPATKPVTAAMPADRPVAADQGPSAPKPKAAAADARLAPQSPPKPQGIRPEQTPKQQTQAKVQPPPAPGVSPDNRRPAAPTNTAKPTTPGVAGVPSAAPAGAPPDKPKDAESGINWVYVVRLGAFQNSASAQELQKKLQQKGYPVVVKSGHNLQKGKTFYVELKPMRDQAQAKGQAERLQKEENTSPMMIKMAETR
jgi:cell division septation protein DedD